MLISEISKTVGAEVNVPNENSEITYLLIDSRKLLAPSEALFFAIKGERHDGHKYIQELHKKGVQNFVVSEDVVELPGANLLKVDSTIEALQKLASHHRQQFDIPVIGITGSNGKTVIKEWLHQLLSPDNSVVRSPKSYNSQVGVPLSVWQMNSGHEIGIFEAGISQPNEMEKLQDVVRPTIGVFTNVGAAHDEGFENRNQKAAEKLRLFANAEKLIYCADHREISEAISQFSKVEKLSWSFDKEATLRINNCEKGRSDTKIIADYNHLKIQITIPFRDDASIENAIHCWLLMLELGYKNPVIAERMAQLLPIAMRLEQKRGVNNCTIINDSYNSDLASFNIALDLLSQQHQHRKKTVVLSDILQSGKESASLYFEVAQAVNAKRIDRFVGIGAAISQHFQKFEVSEKKFYFNTDEFLAQNSISDFANEAILLKGARQFHFEKISSILQQKSHETVLEIDLNALVQNLNWYRAKLKPETKLMAMVKAFSYGSGSYQIANVLQYHRIDYLAVAYADEGVELRKAGITLPIMVMNPEPGSYSAMVKYQLEPEVFNLSSLTRFIDLLNHSDENQDFPVHIKVETGMHRLGFESDQIPELVKLLNTTKAVKVRSIFSHLAASDEQLHDDFTAGQIERFELFAKEIQQALGYSMDRHILNSVGISRFPEAQFEMARLGIGLYGISEENNDLEEVVSLKTTISQVKNVKAGDSVGYSRAGKAERDLRIATVAVGYADGLDRRLGNGNGKMLIKGSFAPIIGNVCMDMCMLDVTEIDCEEGDEVTVFGGSYHVTDFAKDLGTIPYEVLTGISQRVKRVYFQE